MFKFTTLALLAGFATAAATAPSFAQNNNPPPPPRSEPSDPVTSTDSRCDYQLDYMPRVTRALIDSIANQVVDLIPVCENGPRGSYGWLFNNSNVNTLRLPIARNATLMRALTAKGYDEQDVISLRTGGDNSIILYVHQRYLR